VNDKAQMWLRYGVRIVLLVDPETRTVVALPADGPPQTLTEDDTLNLDPALPGFTCSVRDIFEL
jgi:Uma2 family endonuclease